MELTRAAEIIKGWRRAFKRVGVIKITLFIII
jgi:hypothetical protein